MVAAAGAGVAVPLALVLAVTVVLAPGGTSPAFACGTDGAGLAGAIPAEPVAGFEGEQLENAAAIMNTAADMGLDEQAQTIGVMTAIGESSLRVIDYGDDAVNPDGTMNSSIGLFQQQEWWGSRETRLDPAGSARLFYERLQGVEDWQSMEPTLAANAVQGNADPYHYERFWAPAQAIVEALGGAGACVGGLVSDEGWALPADGAITSPYGWRVDPISGVSKFHNGTDFDGACGDPIWAAGAGTVDDVFQDSYGAWIIEMDHGGGVTSWSVHMEREGVLVEEGQTIQAGQQIGLIGSSGYSTGCHLHYELRVDDEPVDAIDFLADLGVPRP